MELCLLFLISYYLCNFVHYTFYLILDKHDRDTVFYYYEGNAKLFLDVCYLIVSKRIFGIHLSSRMTNL